MDNHVSTCSIAQKVRPLSDLFRPHHIIRTGWTIGNLGFDSRRGLRISVFTTASRPALGPTQLPILWVPGVLSLGLKRPVREADHSLPPSAEIKNAWSYTSTPQYICMAWCLVKHRYNFTFTFTFTFSSLLNGHPGLLLIGRYSKVSNVFHSPNTI
jgi:hypothetical protein